MPTPPYWQTQKNRYNLTGEVCNTCGAKLFPPRDVCPECSQPAYEPFTFSGKGEVYSYSTVGHALLHFEEYLPYSVALIRLEEGPLVAAQLTDVDPEQVEIGMRVEMVTRKMQEYGEAGVIVYGYKFRPCLQSTE